MPANTGLSQQSGDGIEHGADATLEFVRFGQQGNGQVSIGGHVEEVAGLSGELVLVNQPQHHFVLIDD